MSDTVKSLKDLFSLVGRNPTLAKRLKSEPIQVAEMFGLKISKEDAERISAKLDLDQILKHATDVAAMPEKVCQGIGLKGE
jgi:hypothetical protein